MSNSKRKSCDGKVRHATLEAALIARNKARKKKSDPIVTGLSVYRCQYCGGFHVGRSKKKGIDWDAVEKRDEELRNLRVTGNNRKIS